jgi:Predicted transcriptional regulators
MDLTGVRVMETRMEPLKIGELARRAGVAVDTVRYYERTGLLPSPQRRPSGYRVYAPDAVARLRFIRRAKALGFSLEEIGELLALSGRRDVGAVRRAAAAKLALIETRIAEMRRVRDGLRQLVETCPGQGPADACPILVALNGEGERA